MIGIIIGLGVDISSVERIRKVFLKKERIQRIFTMNEEKIFTIENGYAFEKISGNFAGKEAFSKALGTGIRGFSFKDIEILRDDLGKPYVVIKNKDKVNKILSNMYEVTLEEVNIHISISHEKKHAVAVVIIETKK